MAFVECECRQSGRGRGPRLRGSSSPAGELGAIRSPADNEEYYFHRNAVLHNDFDRLDIGTEVRFEPEMGEKGMQASTVRIVGKPGARASKKGADAAQPPTGWEH